ncbi:MAG: DNA repair protein RecN [Thermodesulfobacteriota bacterium]
MLRELRITNLALIEELRLTLDAGLAVLTGETGAGKSIVLQAIHLLAGGRAAAGWVRTGAEAAAVEALFELSGHHDELRAQLDEMGIEVEDDLIIRRQIEAKGKSRFYLNGALATAAAVGEAMEGLLSVASQHDHQRLLVPRYHLDFLDAVGDLAPLRQEMAAAYEAWLAAKARCDELRDQERDKEQRRDFLAFQCQEIGEAALVAGEDEALAVERDRLKSSDELTRLGQMSHAALSEEVVAQLAMVRKHLEQMASLDPGVAPLADEVAGSSYQLEESLLALSRYLDTIPNDPARLDEVTARIDLLQRLKRKYGPSLDEVIAFGATAQEELERLESMEAELALLGREMAAREAVAREKAAQLGAARRAVAAGLEGRVRAELISLCFEQAEFAVHFHDTTHDLDHLTRLGWDRPEFVFSANPGEPLKPVAKIASGGELSRLLLALKSLLARQDQVETVIFDEIDAGISGKAAEAVSRKIRELADHHQVLCITHLPPIAAAAHAHFLVAKSVEGERTRTSVTVLTQEERVQELARMIAGDSVTEKTLAFVRELLGRNQ